MKHWEEKRKRYLHSRKTPRAPRVIWDIFQLTIWKYCHSGQKACCYGDTITESFDNLAVVRVGRENSGRGAVGGFQVGVHWGWMRG